MTTKDTARETFAQVESELRELSQWMYDHPEIAYEERETSAKLVEYLSDKGFDVEYPAYGLETAFAARVGSTGPEVVICAEIDALPEVGHACGHNIIATAAIGAGIALAPLVEDLGIRVRVIAVGEGGDEAEYAERKWLPASGTGDASYIAIYPPKVAMITLADNNYPVVVIIDSAAIASTQQILFDTLWGLI